MKLLFGDIHNHCGISYGFGSIKNALENASSHLDFCGITGHAFWPDMPPITDETRFLVDFHEKGFARLKGNYADDVKLISEKNKPGKFTTFISYEMHSHHFGDHHIVSGDMSLPLLTSATTPKEFYEMTKEYSDTIIIPHHIAYTPEFRGINWDEYDENLFPVVEVISKHGCGMSDKHPMPYYHTMGGRDSRNTAYSGLKQGKRFGFVGSTDHHAGYPGSYGDGCLGVWAENNDRHSIIEAIKNRRTYALNGDKIKCIFSVNDHLLGSIVNSSSEKKTIQYRISASYFIDKIIIFKDLKPIKIINGEELDEVNPKGRYKVRVEFGWGGQRSLKTWDFEINTTGGKIVGLEKCFRGKSVLAPTDGVKVSEDCNVIDNHAELVSDVCVSGRVQTLRNETTTSPSTSAVILEINGDLDTKLSVKVNDNIVEKTIRELCDCSYTYQTGITNSPNFKIHQCVPESQYMVDGELIDWSTGRCFYHMEVFQKNGSMALISPVYFD